MNQETFDNLVISLEQQLRLKHTNFREPLSPEEQLAICLRLLATGSSFQTIAFSFRVGVSTVHYVVRRVCDAIWNELQSELLPEPTTDTWRKIADGFKCKWNFPNCCGAIDGKHVTITCPPNSGTLFHNYKGTFSIVLMALSDADYKFITVDIGDYGSNSDGGVFGRSVVGRRLQSDTLDLPTDQPITDIPGENPMPFVMVGDEAFPLGPHLMRPYPGRGLSEDKRIFNYRLSTARRVVESAFGILAQRWRIFRRPITMHPENVVRVVKATVILHNLLQTVRPINPDDDWLPPSNLGNMHVGHRGGSCRRRSDASAVRDAFKAYFCSTSGAVEWQRRAVSLC